MARVAVAGATGFIGSALIAELKKEHHVIALTRGYPRQDEGEDDHGIEWRKCDLFSLLDTERALDGADYAVYLIHSMLPSAQLTQGAFQDLDLLVADNFAKASKLKGLRHIIYVGGIIPKEETLSLHLSSRKEVEKTLASEGVPVTALRAAMVIGKGGSSMNIMTRLVHRLPVMLCPAWTMTKSKPIWLPDMISAIKYCLGRPEVFHKIFDLAGATAVSYLEMIREVARISGKKRYIFYTPIVPVPISRWWISLVTGAPRDLVAPLIATLRNEMLPSPNRILSIPGKNFASFSEAISQALSAQDIERVTPRAFVLPEEERRRKTVRSVQRLALPKGKNAKDVGDLYMQWLPQHLSPMVKVKVEGDIVEFFFPLTNTPLLILHRSPERSSDARQLFYIHGGVLAQKKDRARFEFRETPDGKSILAAIHDFHPMLPWYIYTWTQAIVHLWVMNSFDSYLKNYQNPS